MDIETEFIKMIIGTLIPAVVGYIIAWFRLRRSAALRAEREYKAIKDGMQAILSDRLIYYHGHYIEKGCAPIYARENFLHMYQSYKELGGNGIIENIYSQFMALPTEEQYEERTN